MSLCRNFLGVKYPKSDSPASPVLTDDVTVGAGLLPGRQQGLCSQLPDGPASPRAQDTEAKSHHLGCTAPAPPDREPASQASNSFSSQSRMHTPAASLPTTKLHTPPRDRACRQRQRTSCFVCMLTYGLACSSCLLHVGLTGK